MGVRNAAVHAMIRHDHTRAILLVSWRVSSALAVSFWLSLLFLPPSGQSQNNTPRQSGQDSAPRVRTPFEDAAATDFDNPGGIPDLARLRAFNAARQKSMVSDTDKLLRLVNELNVEIARDGPDSLTPAQLHKVGEIEKLARNVRDKMSAPIVGAPSDRPPLFSPR